MTEKLEEFLNRKIRLMRQQKKPKVSVCVITYNQEKYIRQCLQSIVDQETDFDFEVIVGEDCSTDGTRAIVQEFEERYPGIVKPIYQERNIGGGVHNFLTVHRAARGEYIAHMDGDDYALPGKLQKQFAYLEKNSGCTVVWHRVNWFDDLGSFFPGKEYDYSMFNGGIVTFEKALRLGSVAVHSSIMYRKCAHKTVNPSFDTLDLFYTWEYLSSGWGAILDDVLGEYRANSFNAITRSPGNRIKLLYAHHAKYFFRLHPERRKEIFIFALTNFLVDLKNRRKSAIEFFFLILNTFSLVNPKEFIAHLKDVKKLRVPRLELKR